MIFFYTGHQKLNMTHSKFCPIHKNTQKTIGTIIKLNKIKEIIEKTELLFKLFFYMVSKN
jgi:hypothetical protein